MKRWGWLCRWFAHRYAAKYEGMTHVGWACRRCGVEFQQY